MLCSPPPSQVQDYITAGACLALGLRFAGSANSDAFDCLYEFARTFMKNMFFASTPAVVSTSFDIIALFYLFFVCFNSFFFSGWRVVPVPDGLLQPSDWSVHDSAGHVHGNVWHWPPEGFAAVPFFTPENWR